MIEFRLGDQAIYDAYIGSQALCWICHYEYKDRAEFGAARKCAACGTWVCTDCAQIHWVGNDFLSACRGCRVTD